MAQQAIDLPPPPDAPAPPRALHERVKAALCVRAASRPWVAAAFVSPDGRSLRIHGDADDFEHGLDAHVIGVEVQREIDPAFSVVLDVEYYDDGHRMALGMEGVYEREKR